MVLDLFYSKLVQLKPFFWLFCYRTTQPLLFKTLYLSWWSLSIVIIVGFICLCTFYIASKYLIPSLFFSYISITKNNDNEETKLTLRSHSMQKSPCSISASSCSCVSSNRYIHTEDMITKSFLARLVWNVCLFVC